MFGLFVIFHARKNSKQLSCSAALYNNWFFRGRPCVDRSWSTVCQLQERSQLETLWYKDDNGGVNRFFRFCVRLWATVAFFWGKTWWWWNKHSREQGLSFNNHAVRASNSSWARRSMVSNLDEFRENRQIRDSVDHLLCWILSLSQMLNKFENFLQHQKSFFAWIFSSVKMNKNWTAKNYYFFRKRFCSSIFSIIPTHTSFVLCFWV